MTLSARTAEMMTRIRDTMNPEAAAIRDKADLLARLRVARRSDDLHWLTHHEQGRRILYQLMADCGHQGSTIGVDGKPSAHLEGRRSVAIQLANEIVGIFPDMWLKTLQETMTDNLRA